MVGINGDGVVTETIRSVAVYVDPAARQINLRWVPSVHVSTLPRLLWELPGYEVGVWCLADDRQRVTGVCCREQHVERLVRQVCEAWALQGLIGPDAVDGNATAILNAVAQLWTDPVGTLVTWGPTWDKALQKAKAGRLV